MGHSCSYIFLICFEPWKSGFETHDVNNTVSAVISPSNLDSDPPPVVRNPADSDLGLTSLTPVVRKSYRFRWKSDYCSKKSSRFRCKSYYCSKNSCGCRCKSCYCSKNSCGCRYKSCYCCKTPADADLDASLTNASEAPIERRERTPAELYKSSIAATKDRQSAGGRTFAEIL